MTTQGIIRALENVVEKYEDKPVYTGEIDIPLMCRDVINKLKELSYPWQTGTPTEEGDYLVAVEYFPFEGIQYEINRYLSEPYNDFIYATNGKIVAWQRIEPYKEASE